MSHRLPAQAYAAGGPAGNGAWRQTARAVIGASMGGRQVWQWGVQYPHLMDGLVPMIAWPFPNAGLRGVIDELPVAIIKADPA